MSSFDTQTLHEFLTHTPEGALRKMLVDAKALTNTHCSLLLKIAKGCDAAKFGEHFEKKDFPRVRMNAAEEQLKEKFWDQCTATLLERGILQTYSGQKLAA